jgi:hypothetical protein
METIMLTTNRRSTFLISLLALGFAGSAALAADAPAAMAPDAITWGDAPPILPPGAKIAVLSGDPGAEGPFVLRLQFPSGYDVPAHFHSGDELITVISGRFGIGHGDKLDREKGEVLPVGGFVEMPAGHHHFAWAETDAVVQIHGPGPFDITYLNPADDPLTQ